MRKSTSKSSLDGKSIRKAAKRFFRDSFSLDDLTRHDLADHFGISQDSVLRVISGEEWKTLNDFWLRKRLLKAMRRVYRKSKIKDEFSVTKVLEIERTSRSSFDRLVRSEWLELRAKLPTAVEKVLATINLLLDEDIPARKLTVKFVLARAGVNPKQGKWLTAAMRAARLELSRRQKDRESAPPPDGVEVRPVKGGWIDLDADVWECPFVTFKQTLRKDNLRTDLGDMAWSMLREDLRSEEFKLRTVVLNYEGFKLAGRLLGDEVPDIRAASLEAVQRAWAGFDGTRSQRVGARKALKHLFLAMVEISGRDSSLDGGEMLRIAAWLETSVGLPRHEPSSDFLSEPELDAVIAGCITDIRAGISFTESSPDMATMPTHPPAKENCVPAIRWAAALMILTMAYTGLRRASITHIKVGDWVRLRTGLYALAWRHGKKTEENVAVLPAPIAHQLDLYARRTSALRAALGTEYLFLTGDQMGCWLVKPNEMNLSHHLLDFADRHGLNRDGVRLPLTSTVLRRTYATRQLYEGKSLWLLSLQLGHSGIATTERYAKHDRYEHPHQVRGSLDDYGRAALTRWHRPALVSELDPAERARVLSGGDEYHQEVGVCSQSRCVKVAEGGPPPCSMCEYLVTGHEFLGAWEKELAGRERELERLKGEPGSSHTYAQMKYQFDRFLANYDRVKGVPAGGGKY